MNTPTLHTDRLILRQFTIHDLDAFHEIFTDETVNTFLPWFIPKTREASLAELTQRFLSYYDADTSYRYAVCLKEENKPIGYITLGEPDSYDFGYAILSQYQKKGYITEGAHCILNTLSQTQIPYITATHDINNPASGEVMKKLGMKYQYSYTEFWEPKGYDVTFRLYQLNFDPNAHPYMKYWNLYKRHEIESL
ncbi:GNAT family acetyltransferase [Erysipelothrix larvae]|uniref:GNAT family acetyltransferase n=1 Tax=Erysipelothrix larvae TaxID=1514105 RepID=A0A109UGP6_9FIRM|nr:GNAT family N-acetyltransferase [Erysipelothrix larvae]AMC93000.1 GNAT family acetyltransferase [Erysipelothrix larvae]